MESWRPTIDGLEFDFLDETESLSLERDFEKEEILEALKEVEGDKTPRPDGFTMAFFQKCWSVVERDVWLSLQIFIEHGIFEKSLNATFLCLIPKKVSAVNIKDFRPVSRVGSLYKLLAKVLAHRLRGVPDKLVFDS